MENRRTSSDVGTRLHKNYLFNTFPTNNFSIHREYYLKFINSNNS